MAKTMRPFLPGVVARAGVAELATIQVTEEMRTIANMRGDVRRSPFPSFMSVLLGLGPGVV